MGNGRVQLPGGLQGAGLPSTQQLLAALVEQAEWPLVSEWVTIKELKFAVDRQPDGVRVIVIIPQGSRRGYRIPLQPLNAAMVARELAGGAPVVPESDEVAAAAPAADGPPTPPTMGQQS